MVLLIEIQKKQSHNEEVFKKYESTDSINGIIIDNTSIKNERIIDLLKESEKWKVHFTITLISSLSSSYEIQQYIQGIKIPSVAIHSF